MKIIIGNWKENPETFEEGVKLIQISEKFENGQDDHLFHCIENKLEIKGSNFKIAHAVPSIFAERLYIEAKKTKIILQNISTFETGSHTGEISVKQMINCGIQGSIIGHSETRLSPNNPRGDEDKQVNSKLKILFANDCGAVLCIGEFIRDKNRKEYIEKQIVNCLNDLKIKDFENLVLAYEPIWAIGKDAKRVATNEEITETINFIKSFVKDKFTFEAKVLYGGSVDENNAKEIVNLENVDGLLIGRASSDTVKWKALLENLH